MLLNFRIENFRSIKDLVEFSFEASTVKEHPDNWMSHGQKKILSTSVMYGANASGKSNVLRALSALRYLVANSADFDPEDALPPYEPFLLDVDWRHRPVRFEIEFYLDELWYAYRVSFTQKEITQETLSFRPHNKEAVLYDRQYGQEMTFGDHYKGEKKSVERKLLPNQLFLSKAARDNVALLIPVYSFLERKLGALLNIEGYQESRLQQLFAERLADPEDTEFKQRFNQILCALDTGISQVTAEKIDWEAQPLPGQIPEKVAKEIRKNYEYQIQALHPVYKGDQRVDEIPFELDEESRGTRSLLPLLGIILDALEGGSVLVVDEFEKHLHSHITKTLIKLFHNPEVNQKRAQLLFATHDISQLDSDVFRRDQIWFVEKNERGATELFSLSEVEGVRANIPYDKWYDSGKFGATPIIDQLSLTL